MKKKDFEKLKFEPSQIIWVKATAGYTDIEIDETFCHGFPLKDDGESGVFFDNNWGVNSKQRIF